MSTASEATVTEAEEVKEAEKVPTVKKQKVDVPFAPNCQMTVHVISARTGRSSYGKHCSYVRSPSLQVTVSRPLRPTAKRSGCYIPFRSTQPFGASQAFMDFVVAEMTAEVNKISNIEDFKKWVGKAGATHTWRLDVENKWRETMSTAEVPDPVVGTRVTTPPTPRAMVQESPNAVPTLLTAGLWAEIF